VSRVDALLGDSLAYVGSQISGHMQMAAALKVLDGHTSGKLNEARNISSSDCDGIVDRAQDLSRPNLIFAGRLTRLALKVSKAFWLYTVVCHRSI
jgi:hypothetical protein